MRITEIVKELNLGNCVLHAAVRLLDLFMDAHGISAERLHGVAYACLFVAAKFELEGRQLPQFSEICKLGRIEPIPKYELLELEFQILSYVNWDMCMPNVTTFLNFFKKFTLSNNDYKEWSMKVSHANCTYEELKTIIENNINLYLAATLLDVHLTLLPPSLVAAACLLAARQQLYINYWPVELKWFNLYSYSQIDIVAIRLTNMLKKKDQYNETVICKRRHVSEQFDDEDDGYSTGKSSIDGSARKRRRV